MSYYDEYVQGISRRCLPEGKEEKASRMRAKMTKSKVKYIKNLDENGK